MIVYSNSCSFAAPNQGHLIYPEVVAKSLQAELVNCGRPLSCNRRIIRSTLRDLVELTQEHTDITALVGLSFLFRTELWQPNSETSKKFWAPTNDLYFYPIDINYQQFDWSAGITNTSVPNIHKAVPESVREYHKHWLEHYNKEAATIELITDLIMLLNFAQNNNIKMLIFCNTQTLSGLPEVNTDAVYLKSLTEYIKQQKSVVDLWDFSFSSYSRQLGHTPKDIHLYGNDGHPGEQAHVDFAENIIIPTLKGIVK
jgi:hypothetical protein